MSSSDMPEPVAKRLGYALKRAQHALRMSMDEALRPLALTTPQYAVLCAVEAEPGLSNARLARAAFVTPQTMQGVLANLERAGLLHRRPDPHHGRVLCSELTGAGSRRTHPCTSRRPRRRGQDGRILRREGCGTARLRPFPMCGRSPGVSEASRRPRTG